MASVLIVDDDVRLLSSFERVLAGEGYEVITAGTGETGLIEMNKAVPDLVIMDLRMPGMDGFDAFRAMRKISQDVPIILMTAYGTPEAINSALDLGGFDFILKPFEIPEILDLIRKALKTRAAPGA